MTMDKNEDSGGYDRFFLSVSDVFSDWHLSLLRHFTLFLGRKVPVLEGSIVHPGWTT